MSSSIPSGWPSKDFFQQKYDKGTEVHRLNVSALPKNQCNMFFPASTPCEEFLIATALEHMAFNPANERINDRFNMKIIMCGGIEFMWCYFPKEFQDVCERAGAVFGMTMKIMSRAALTEDGRVEFPKHDNIVIFQGKRSLNPDKILKECDRVREICNDLERLGLD